MRDIAEKADLARMAQARLKLSGDATGRTIARMTRSYVLAGQRVFVVGQKMQSMFDATSLKNVVGDMVQVPHSTFYMELPDCRWELWGGSTGWHQIAGVYVQRTDDFLGLLIWGGPNEKSMHPADDSVFWVTFSLASATAAGKDIESAMDYVLRDGRSDKSQYQIRLDTLPEADREKMFSSILSILRVTVNTLLYLSSEKPEIETEDFAAIRRDMVKRLEGLKSKAKKRKLKKRIERAPAHVSVHLGLSIEKTARANARYHWVRGHWRNVPCNEGYNLRWIQPYERNKETA
jgi:hypothetical protein